ARDSAEAAGRLPRSLLPDPGAVLPLPAGPAPAAGRAAERGADVGPVRFLARGRSGLPDAAAGHPARPGIRASQRQPLGLAAIPVDAVRRARLRRTGTELPALLVDAAARRPRALADDLRPLFHRAVRAGSRDPSAGDRHCLAPPRGAYGRPV